MCSLAVFAILMEMSYSEVKSESFEQKFDCIVRCRLSGNLLVSKRRIF